jgi:diaminohydroxyphosphoribosylaminopyrimidine deaminase/5-amino-6-(5-phosphoribosylamino)uracil reductase
VLRWPVRVVVDGSLRVPASARLFTAGSSEEEPAVPGPGRAGASWIVCREGARGLAAARARAGRVLEVPALEAGQVDLVRTLRALADAGLTSILVEGGGRLAAALLRADLVDEVHWFLAPRLIGDDGRPALGAMGLERLRDALSLDAVAVRRCGPDLHLSGRVSREGKASLPSLPSRKRRAKGRK